ncbi:MAG: hypothetical protein SOW59_08530 [Corynebacterium sp.]|nr:hypothetical protein [Corynebacterium sp.]
MAQSSHQTIDEQLVGLIDALIIDSAVIKRPRRRLWTPGQSSLAAMTMRRLVHETVATYYYQQASKERRSVLANEFAERGFKSVAVALHNDAFSTPNSPSNNSIAPSSLTDIVSKAFNKVFAPGTFLASDRKTDGLSPHTIIADSTGDPAQESLREALLAVNAVLIDDVAAAIVQQQQLTLPEPEPAPTPEIDQTNTDTITL